MRLGDGNAAFVMCLRPSGTGWRAAGALARLRPGGQTWRVMTHRQDGLADGGTYVGFPMPPFGVLGVASMRRMQQLDSRGLVTPCAKAPRRIAVASSVASTLGLVRPLIRLQCLSSGGSPCRWPPLPPCLRISQRQPASAAVLQLRPSAAACLQRWRTTRVSSRLPVRLVRRLLLLVKKNAGLQGPLLLRSFVRGCVRVMTRARLPRARLPRLWLHPRCLARLVLRLRPVDLAVCCLNLVLF